MSNPRERFPDNWQLCEKCTFVKQCGLDLAGWQECNLRDIEEVSRGYTQLSQIKSLRKAIKDLGAWNSATLEYAQYWLRAINSEQLLDAVNPLFGTALQNSRRNISFRFINASQYCQE